MARHRLTADEAFDRLRQESQRRNAKLRSVADGIVGDRPPAVSPSQSRIARHRLSSQPSRAPPDRQPESRARRTADHRSPPVYRRPPLRRRRPVDVRPPHRRARSDHGRPGGHRPAEALEGMQPGARSSSTSPRWRSATRRGLGPCASRCGSGRAEHPPPPPVPRRGIVRRALEITHLDAPVEIEGSLEDVWQPPLTSPPWPTRSRSRCPTVTARRCPPGPPGPSWLPSIGRRLAEAAVVVDVDGVLARPGRRAAADGDDGGHRHQRDRPRPLRDPPLDRPRDGAGRARPVARAADFGIGPPIEDGFYYDFDLPDGATFTPDDLPRIEARMREIIAPSSRSSGASTRRTRPGRCSRPSAEARDHRRGRGPDVRHRHRSGRRPTPTRRPSSTCAAARTSSTPAATSAHFKLTAGGRPRTGGATRSASSCSGSTARRGSRRRRSRPTCTELEEAEKRDHRKLGVRARPVPHRSAQLGGGLAAVPPQGRPHPQG